MQFRLLAIAVCLLLVSCSMSNPKDEWLGTWYDASRDLKLEFFDNGTWSASINFEGESIKIPNMGTWFVEDDYYEVKTSPNPKYGIVGQTGTGTWEIKGDKLTLYRSRDGGTTILRRVD